MTAETRFVFLQCSERSGSNLIARLFDAHSAFCSPPPAHLIRTYCDHSGTYGNLLEPNNWTQLLQDVATGLDVMLGSWSRNWSATQLAHLAPIGQVDTLFQELLAHEAEAQNKTGIFLKENRLYQHMPFVLSAFPSSRTVYQVRDPRDMAWSWKCARELRGDVERASRVWLQDQTEGLRVLSQLQPMGRMKWHRYEDLVDDPAGTLQPICEYLGVNYETNMLQFHENQRSQRHAKASRTWENVSRPIMTGNHGKWRGQLTEDELMLIEWRCGHLMDRFEYPRALPTVSDAEGQAALERIRPLERHTKPAYAQVPQDEKVQRARAAKYWAELGDRPSRLEPTLIGKRTQ